MTSLLFTRYVEAGACVLATDQEVLVSCELEAVNCPSGSTFLSSRQLHQQGVSRRNRKNRRQLQHPVDVNTAGHEHLLSCLTASETNDVTLGRCTSTLDLDICTSHATGCQVANQFVPQDPTCTVTNDLRYTTMPSPSIYPSCIPDALRSSEYVCVWDLNQCSSLDPNGGSTDNDFGFPASGLGAGRCNCHHVQTGACFHAETQSYHCAVSEQACDNQTTFVQWNQLTLSQFGPGLDCRLCREQQEQVPNAPPSSWPPIQDEGTVKDQQDNDDSTDEPLVAGIGFVVGVAATCLVLGLIWLIQRHRSWDKESDSVLDNNNKVTSFTEQDQQRPVSEIELSTSDAGGTTSSDSQVDVAEAVTTGQQTPRPPVENINQLL